MLEALSAAVDDLDPAELASCPAGLAGAFERFDRWRARLVDAVGRFDADSAWAADSATSAVGWLKANARQAAPTAAGLVTMARRLRVLPVTAAALADGTLSADQGRAVLAAVDSDLTDEYAEAEEALVPLLAELGVRDVGTVMQQWQARARADKPDPAPPDEKRRLHLSRQFDGTWRFDGNLTTEGGTVVGTAMKHAASRDCDGEPACTPAQRRADALVDVCRWFLDHRTSPTTARRRPHIDPAASVDDLVNEGPARTTDGIVFDAATLQRLACDAAISRLLVRGRSHLLDYGTSVRTVPAALFLALVQRDRHCRWPGCDRAADWCEGHHVRLASHRGPTELGNLALLCVRHHHLLHRPGWHVTLDADATLTISGPDGRVLTSRPPPIVDQLTFDTG